MARRGMRGNRIVSTDSCIYRETPGGEEIEIEVSVSGTATPYWAGDYDNPPEGGEIEDVSVSFYDESANKMRAIQVSNDELIQLTEQLADAEMDYEPDDEPYDEPDYDYEPDSYVD
jgi:hypothetical protein